MTAHPIDIEALRARAAHVYRHGGPANAIESLAANIPAILDRLAAAEHRATRAEAQSEARRVDIEYWQGVARGNAVTVDVWKETALQERGAALDALEQIKVRDARIKAVERLAYAADDGTEYEHNGHDPAEGEAECPGCWALGIRRALDGDA